MLKLFTDTLTFEQNEFRYNFIQYFLDSFAKLFLNGHLIKTYKNFLKYYKKNFVFQKIVDKLIISPYDVQQKFMFIFEILKNKKFKIQKTKNKTLKPYLPIIKKEFYVNNQNFAQLFLKSILYDFKDYLSSSYSTPTFSTSSYSIPSSSLTSSSSLIPTNISSLTNSSFTNEVENIIPQYYTSSSASSSVSNANLSDTIDTNYTPSFRFGVQPTIPEIIITQEEKQEEQNVSSFVQNFLNDDKTLQFQMRTKTNKFYGLNDSTKLSIEINGITFEFQKWKEIIDKKYKLSKWDTRLYLEYTSFLTREQILDIQKIILKKIYDFFVDFKNNTNYIQWMSEIKNISDSTNNQNFYKDFETFLKNDEELKETKKIVYHFMKLYAFIYFVNVSKDEKKYSEILSFHKATHPELKSHVFKVTTSDSFAEYFFNFFTLNLRNQYIEDFLIPFLQSSCSPFCVFQNFGTKDLKSDIDISILNTRGSIMKYMAQEVTDKIFKSLFEFAFENNNFEFKFQDDNRKTVKINTKLNYLFDVNIYPTGWYNFCFSPQAPYPFISPVNQCTQIQANFLDSSKHLMLSQINFAAIRWFQFFYRKRDFTDDPVANYVNLSLYNLFWEKLFKFLSQSNKNRLGFSKDFFLFSKEIEKNPKKKDRMLFVSIYHVENVMRKYQSFMKKLTESLNKIKKETFDTTEETIDPGVIRKYQNVIQKIFEYEYFSLQSNLYIYEEEAYNSIGAYLHVVIQLQGKQFNNELFSPFVYIMSFFDNFGMFFFNPNSSKYIERIFDAIRYFIKHFDNVPSSLHPHAQDIQNWCDDNEIVNLKNELPQGFKYPKKDGNFSDEYKIKLGRILYLFMEVVKKIITNMNQVGSGYDYAPYEPKTNESLEYILPSNYKFFSENI